MSREIHVRDAGLLALIQDTGRRGFQRFGVSVSGAVDGEALRIGNLLVGNDGDAAAIEVTFGGAEFEFRCDATVAVAGADLGATLDGTAVSPWEAFHVSAGSVVQFSGPRSGLRAYLAVDGGVATMPVLGSRSTHVSAKLGGITGAPLQAGDVIPLGESFGDATAGASLPPDLRPSYDGDLAVRVVLGPQHDQFTDAGLETFLSSTYTVTASSDRQGIRLDGPEIEAKDGRYDIVSDATVSGSIQVPGDGKPIVLMADSQTTGGYAKIGVVAAVDLSLLAQAAPGTAVRFTATDVAEAQGLMRARRQQVMAADLQGDLETFGSEFAIDGVQTAVELRYRRDQVSQPGGGQLLAMVNGDATTVRVEEAD